MKPSLILDVASGCSLVPLAVKAVIRERECVGVKSSMAGEGLHRVSIH